MKQSHRAQTACSQSLHTIRANGLSVRRRWQRNLFSRRFHHRRRLVAREMVVKRVVGPRVRRRSCNAPPHPHPARMKFNWLHL